MEQTVRLLGDLGERYGEKHVYYDLRTPADAIKLLCINKPAFQEELIHAHENGVGYRLIQAGTDLDYADLQLPLGSNDLILTPVITGSGGGTGRILAGVGLIAAAIVLGPAVGGFMGLGAGLAGTGGVMATSVLGASAAGIIGGMAATTIGAIGASLVLSGVSQLLSPQPTIPNMGGIGGGSIRGSGESGATDGPQSVTRGADGRQSYSYTGAANTVGVGATIPVVYGKALVGSQLLSARIVVEDESDKLKKFIRDPGPDTVLVGGEELQGLTYASGFRFRKWTPSIVKFTIQSSDGVGTANRRRTLSLDEGNTVTLAEVDYKDDVRRKNYMIWFNLPNGLFDFVSGPGTTRVDGFITFQVDLAISKDGDDPDVGSFQVTIQGLLLPGQTYRWMQYIQYPELDDDLSPDNVKTKVSIIDFRCHSSCKLRIEANGYEQFRKNSYNVAPLSS
jgi:predicted phage tail protein